jgi:hypothetical protein
MATGSISMLRSASPSLMMSSGRGSSVRRRRSSKRPPSPPPLPTIPQKHRCHDYSRVLVEPTSFGERGHATASPMGGSTLIECGRTPALDACRALLPPTSPISWRSGGRAKKGPSPQHKQGHTWHLLQPSPASSSPWVRLTPCPRGCGRPQCVACRCRSCAASAAADTTPSRSGARIQQQLLGSSHSNVGF